MRLLINTGVLRFGGAIQVALSFIHECRNHPEHEYHVVVGPGLDALLTPSEFPAHFKFYKKNFGAMSIRNAARVGREMSMLERDVRPECVVTTSGPAYWRSRAPHLMGFNLPLYIYPESPYLKTLPTLLKARLVVRRWLHCRYFRRDADALIVQTNDVNQRVRRLLGTDRVYTVTNNHSGWYDNPPPTVQRLPEKSKTTFRLLTLTSYYPHKNLELIPEIIKALPESTRSRAEFVLTLTEREYRNRLRAEPPRRVRLVGPVPPPEAPSLYRECDAMLLPTLAECFSASYPEAMKMQKPIVTSDLGFARSICGDAALFFTPCDARSAAKQIGFLMHDPALRRDLAERGRAQLSAFDTAAERAEKILDICERIVHERARVCRAGAPS